MVQDRDLAGRLIGTLMHSSFSRWLVPSAHQNYNGSRYLITEHCAVLCDSRASYLSFPNYFFVIYEAGHFKFCVLIDTEEYKCEHDILLSRVMCSGSCETL